MNITLITTCTNRKKGGVSNALTFDGIPANNQAEVFDMWAKLVSETPTEKPARDTYCGRGFQQAIATSSSLRSDLKVISAGLGLVPASMTIPTYNATLSRSSVNCIARKIRGNFDAGIWWQRLNETTKWGSSIASLAKDKNVELILITLSSAYIPLIKNDLENITPRLAKKIRIVGLRSIKNLPAHMQKALMPYDERFDGPDGETRGTRSDFPQRTTRHFAENFLTTAPNASQAKHAQMVRNYLTPLRFPTGVTRQKMTDEEMTAAIRKHWVDVSGKSSKMLRLFRDELLIACEQKRFSTLFNQVKSQGVEI